MKSNFFAEYVELLGLLSADWLDFFQLLKGWLKIKAAENVHFPLWTAALIVKPYKNIGKLDTTKFLQRFVM